MILKSPLKSPIIDRLIIARNNNSRRSISQFIRLQTNKLTLPSLYLNKVQEFKNFNFIPSGVLINHINNGDGECLNIDILYSLNIEEIEQQLERCEVNKVSRVFHLIISNLNAQGNESDLIKILKFHLNKNLPILPLSYIPLLNNLKQYKDYNLWLQVYNRMKFDNIKLYKEEILEELLEDLLPQLKKFNRPNYFQTNFKLNLTFNTLTELIENYSEMNRIPNIKLTKLIIKITKKINIGGYNSEFRQSLKDRWIAASISLLLKQNDLRSAYSLYSESFIKSPNVINRFLEYHKSIWNRDGLEEFWDKLEGSKFNPNLQSFKLILAAYFNMRDLRGAQNILLDIAKVKEIKYDKEFFELIINGFIKTSSNDLDSVLSVLNSTLLKDNQLIPNYELILISMEAFIKINQLDHIEKLYNLFLIELKEYLKADEHNNGEEGMETNPSNTINYSDLTKYFDIFIKYNQDPLDIDNHRFEEFFNSFVSASYPTEELRNFILNAWLLSLINTLINLSEDKSILIACITLIQKNHQGFEFSDEIVNKLNDLNQ